MAHPFRFLSFAAPTRRYFRARRVRRLFQDSAKLGYVGVFGAVSGEKSNGVPALVQFQSPLQRIAMVVKAVRDTWLDPTLEIERVFEGRSCRVLHCVQLSQQIGW
jgi:hypothetical protein